MPTAAKILTLGGLGSLLFSFTMGFVLSQARLKDPERDESVLTNVHVVSLWEGFMLLGLVWAVVLSDLSSGIESLAAVLLVAAAALQAGAAFTAWRGGITNLFANTKTATYAMAVSNAILGAVGLVILVVGSLKGL
jgi:hypothetical protein